MENRIYYTPKQREADELLDKNSVLIFGGGIRGGKSYFLLLTILTYCFQYPKSRWLVLRESMPTIKRNLFPTFNKLLDSGFRQYMTEWNQSTQEVTFCNESQILFMAESFDDDKELNRFRGLEINGAALDEINEMHIETFYKVIERSGSWQSSNAPIKIIGTCNPSHGWVKELFYDAHKRGTLKKGWAFVQSLITDNPYISKDYLKSLTDNMPKYEYEVFVKGNWDIKLEGVLFSREDFNYFKAADLKAEGLECILGYGDVADEGDDFFSLPIGKIYNGKIFVTDIIFTDENIDVTLPLCVGIIKLLNVNHICIETNNQGSAFVKMLYELVPSEKILGLNNSASKHTRILMQYAFIKKYFYFLHESEYEAGSHYDKFMRQIFSYMKAKDVRQHDDAADSLSGLANLCQNIVPHLFETSN